MEELTKEERVLKYIRTRRLKSILIFKPFNFNYYSRKNMSTEVEIKIEQFNDLFDLILQILTLAKTNCSVNIRTQKLETTARRSRSTYDIWRHVKYYLPETTIFEILREMYKHRNYFYFQYCYTVKRLVFKLKPTPTNIYLEECYVKDEFGICFKNWETIGLEGE
jgi:hypothetical protein